MNLSRKTIRNATIAGAILFVLAMIIWRWVARSSYIVNTISTAGASSSEGILYSNLATCTNTFVTSALSKLAVHTGTPACNAANGNISVNTLVPHTYVAGDSIVVGGVSSDGTSISSNIIGTATVVSVGADKLSYVYNIGAYCAPASLTGSPGYSYKSGDTLVTPLDTTRAACYQTAVSTYMTSKCSYSPSSPPSSPANTYTADITRINNAYADLIIQAAVAGNVNGVTKATIELARKADYTSAIRNFYQSVCPGYYAQTSTIDPGSTAAGTSYPASPYSSYSSTGSVSSGSYFDSTRITTTNIATWATYATGGANANKTGASIYPTGTPNSTIATDIGPGTVLVTYPSFTWGST